MRVRANEELFDKWNDLCDKISCGRSLVQNDQEVSSEQLNEWVGMQFGLMREYRGLVKEMMDYVLEGDGHERVEA